MKTWVNAGFMLDLLKGENKRSGNRVGEELSRSSKPYDREPGWAQPVFLIVMVLLVYSFLFMDSLALEARLKIRELSDR